MFHGEVFHGGWRLRSEYERRVRDFLQARGHALDPDSGYCFWEDTPGAANGPARKEIDEDRTASCARQSSKVLTSKEQCSRKLILKP